MSEVLLGVRLRHETAAAIGLHGYEVATAIGLHGYETAVRPSFHGYETAIRPSLRGQASTAVRHPPQLASGPYSPMRGACSK